MQQFFNQKTLSVYAASENDPDNAFQEALKEVKSFIRVDNTDDDDLIMEFIGASVQAIQNYTRRSIVNKTYEFTIDRPSGFEDGIESLGAGDHTGSRSYLSGGGSWIDLPLPPLVSVTSITTYDTANTATVFSSAYYQLNLSSGRIYLNQGQVWPVALRDRAAMVIRYVAGYGAAFSDIPVDLRLAIKGHVGAMYDSRTLLTIPDAIKKNLSGYRLLDALAAI